jgi:hypothetical protein
MTKATVLVNAAPRTSLWIGAPLALVVSALLSASAQAAGPAGPFPSVLVPGEVVTATGTPNLWIADEEGIVHFASDPGALAGHRVDWNAQFALNPVQVPEITAGAPWLTAALVKIGDAIYLPQFSPDGGLPTLRRIQSPDDLAVLGINASNYGQYVLDASAWEQQYHLPLARVLFDGDFFLQPPAPATDTGSDTTMHGDGGSGSDTTLQNAADSA